MYLHIGNHFMVRKETILGIFDLDNSSWSRWTRQLLDQAEREGRVVNAALDEIPNAFLLCEEQGTTTVYLSMLTVQTLQRRAGERLFGGNPAAAGR